MFILATVWTPVSSPLLLKSSLLHGLYVGGRGGQHHLGRFDRRHFSMSHGTVDGGLRGWGDGGGVGGRWVMVGLGPLRLQAGTVVVIVRQNGLIICHTVRHGHIVYMIHGLLRQAMCLVHVVGVGGLIISQWGLNRVPRGDSLHGRSRTITIW